MHPRRQHLTAAKVGPFRGLSRRLDHAEAREFSEDAAELPDGPGPVTQCIWLGSWTPKVLNDAPRLLVDDSDATGPEWVKEHMVLPVSKGELQHLGTRYPRLQRVLLASADSASRHRRHLETRGAPIVTAQAQSSHGPVRPSGRI
jgi:hypothetical protein